MEIPMGLRETGCFRTGTFGTGTFLDMLQKLSFFDSYLSSIKIDKCIPYYLVDKDRLLVSQGIRILPNYYSSVERYS